MTECRGHLDQGDWDDAEDSAEVGLSYFPDSAELKLLLAETEFARGNYSTARGITHEVIAGSKAFPKAIFDAGRLLEEYGDVEATLKVYPLLFDYPTGAIACHAHYEQARLLQNLRRLDEAFQETVAGIALGDHSKLHWMYVTFLRDRLVDLESVDEIAPLLHAENSDVRKPTESLFLAISEAYRTLGDFDAAASYLEKAKSVPYRRFQFPVRWRHRPPLGEPAKPSFLIIGGWKCGTEALYKLVAEHPDVAEPLTQEIQFFRDPSAPDHWYLAHFPCLKNGKNKITGEASPDYYSQNIQLRVRQLFPDIKFICILRHPVERALAHWHHINEQGRIEDSIDDIMQRDFEFFEQLVKQPDDLIEHELFTMWDEESTINHVIALGFYYYFLKRWFREFSAEQFLLLNFSEFAARPVETMKRVYQFLDLRDFSQMENPIVDLETELMNEEKTNVFAEKLYELYGPSLQKLHAEFGMELKPTTQSSAHS